MEGRVSDMRAAAKRVLHATGAYGAALEARPFPGVAVLCYHAVLADDADRTKLPFAGLHVSAARFDAHCALVAAHCDALTLADAEAVWAGTVPMPPRPVLVTFDDGHRGVLQHALPALQRHAVPAVLFACTAPIAQGQSFWFDAVARAEGEAAVEAAKTLPWADWHALVNAHAEGVTRDDPVAPLSSAELQRLARDPLITVAAHTATHLVLARAPRHVQGEEIVASLDAVEAWTGQRPTAFAYPNGRPAHDYTAVTRAVLEEAGIRTAFTTHEGFATREEPALERSRFVMLDGVDGAELAHRLAFSWPRVGS